VLSRVQILTGLIGLGIALLAFLWWHSGHVAYEPVWAEEVDIAGDTFKVRRWEGVASPDDPGGLRACFLLQQEIQAPPELNPKVPEAPDWLRCFNSEFIAQALASGEGKAYVAGRNRPPGYDLIVAVLPGGRMYIWPQPNGE
jgi:hypothetical protein